MFSYSAEHIAFLRENYPRMTRPELTEAFNDAFGLDKTEGAIKSTIKVHKIKSGRASGMRPATSEIKSKLFNKEQVEFITKNYTEMSRKDLLSALNEKFDLSVELNQLVSFVKNHKINSGRNGYFVKGQKSWNAGTKGILKANSGSFKKGDKPANYHPVGHERVDSKDGYILVKVADKNPWKSSKSGWYRHKHVVVWEQHNGSVPDGMCVRFKDNDKRNFDINNLFLVSRGEHIRLNQMGYSEQPEELKPIVINIAKLDQASFDKTKQLKEPAA